MLIVISVIVPVSIHISIFVFHTQFRQDLCLQSNTAVHVTIASTGDIIVQFCLRINVNLSNLQSSLIKENFAIKLANVKSLPYQF